MAGGRLGAEALRRVRARVSRSGARFGGVSVRVRRLCCGRRAALRAPVRGVEELVERLRQDAVPAHAAVEARRRVGGAGVAGARAAFHQELPASGARAARPAVPVHDVLGVAVR